MILMLNFPKMEISMGIFQENTSAFVQASRGFDLKLGGEKPSIITN